MKKNSFLKKYKFINKGIYDNENVFENTLESIKETVKKKYGLYLTIRKTKDNKFVVYEDKDLSRIHNLKDKIEDITYEELLYLSFFHIPLLEEVLKEVNGKVPIIFSLKIKLNNKDIFKILNNYKKDFAIISRNNKVLNYISKNYPDFIIGEAITKKIKFNLSLLLIKPDFYSYNIDYYDSHKLKSIKEENRIIIGFLVNTKEKYNNYKNDFDNVIVDNYYNVLDENSVL